MLRRIAPYADASRPYGRATAELCDGKAVNHLKVRCCLIDGEVVCCDAEE